MKEKPEIVVIAGGSFQGKSIVAINLAQRFRYSGVVSTDMVRNFLKVSHPKTKYYSTSTYLLSADELAKQMDAVSNLVQEIIPIYQSRGEYVIFEGMHFSERFLSWSAEQGFTTICLDNRKSFPERIILKSKTRSKLKMQNIVLHEGFIEIDNENVNETIYIKYNDVISNIHKSIVEACIKYGFNIVEFRDIKEAIELCSEILINR